MKHSLNSCRTPRNIKNALEKTGRKSEEEEKSVMKADSHLNEEPEKTHHIPQKLLYPFSGGNIEVRTSGCCRFSTRISSTEIT